MRATIIGTAESAFCERQDDLNLEEMVFFTAKKALADAGLERADIDTVIQAGDDVMDGININHVYQVEAAGSYLKEESKIEEDGAFALFYGLCRLSVEKFQTALIIGYSKSSESSVEFIKKGKARSQPEPSGEWYYYTQMDPFLLRPLGLDNLAYHGMQFNHFLQNSQLSEEDIARITVKNKKAGLKNENAPFAADLSLSDVLESEEVASPLKALELPSMTDGVSAVIISTEKFARERKKSGPVITGFGTASDAYYPGYRRFFECPTAALASRKALSMAALKPGDIDRAELYELFPFQEAMLYREIFGWDYPEIREKLRSNFTAEDGELPVNASGGVRCAHPIMAAGLSRVIHASRYLKAGQGKNALAHAQSGMGMQSNIFYVLQA